MAGRDHLIRQFDAAWKLASFHLGSITTEECLWRPSLRGPHVHKQADGTWHADWPDQDGYDVGPPSIAWLTWNIGFWWSMVLEHSFGGGTLSREHVKWSGSADAMRGWLGRLHAEWREALHVMTEDDYASTRRTHWPLTQRPFSDVVAWVNMELTKNAAQIGYVRLLYAVRA